MRILKELFRSPAMILFFGVFAIWLFFRPTFDNIFGNGVSFEPLDETGANIDNEKAKSIAEGLYTAMYKFGTDESKIYSLLKGVNYGDYAKIYNQFGTRYYIEYIGTWGDRVTGVNLDLYNWLNNELTAKEMEHLRKITNRVF